MLYVCDVLVLLLFGSVNLWLDFSLVHYFALTVRIFLNLFEFSEWRGRYLQFL